MKKILVHSMICMKSSIVALVFLFNFQIYAKTSCHDVLSSQKSICGIEINQLEKVDKLCFDFSGTKYRTAFYVNNKIIAGINYQGKGHLDGGSHSYDKEFGLELVIPRGATYDIADCSFYLNRDHDSFFGDESREVNDNNELLKYHICDGDFLERKTHPEERCRTYNR